MSFKDLMTYKRILIRHIYTSCRWTTADTVIPCSGTLADRPPSLLPCLIDGRCQPLFSPESKSSHTDQVLLDEDSTGAARRRYLRVRTRDHQQSRAMASCTPLFPLALLILFPFSLLGARTRLLPSRLPAVMMAFFPLLTSPPVFLPPLPSGARALCPRARVRLNRLLLHPFLVRHPRPLGRIPFPLLPSPLPSFLHLFLIRLLSSRLFLFHPSPSHPCLRFLLHFTLFFFTFVQSHNVLCHVLS